MNKKVYIGIDLGGTSIKIGLVSETGELIKQTEIPTRKKAGHEAIIFDIISNSKKLVDETGLPWENVLGLGLGIPGMLDLDKGIVSLAPNLNWEDIPIVSLLKEKLNIPIKMDNDGNIAALGEAWVGAGKAYRHVVMATIGTGIGAGIIIDNQILHGKSGMAAELGHIPISDEGIICGCGNIGCLETISSATGIIRQGQLVVKEGRKSILTEKYSNNVDEITAKSVIDAAKLGDQQALAIVTNAGKLLGKGLATTANLFDPEIIIIGGGVSRAGDILFDPIKQGFYQHGLNKIVESVHIVPAILGNNAGMIGAAALFLKY